MRVRKNDTVEVLAGREKGKRGKVRQILLERDAAIVAELNIYKRHTKPGQGARQAGIIDVEGPIHLSNLAVVCTKCNKATRVANRFLADGSKARVCKHCHEVI